MNAPKLIATGYQGQVFDLGDGTVAKVFPPRTDVSEVQIEAEVAHFCAELGLSTPPVVGVKAEDGARVIRFEKVEGVTLTDMVMQSPWRMIWATQRMAQLFVNLHKIKVEGLRSMKKTLRDRIGRAPELSEWERDAALTSLEDLEDGNQLCHFDYHPGNVLVSKEQCFVIDWGDARSGAPLADITHALVLNRVDGDVQNAPLVNRVVVRWLRALYLELFIFFYARASEEYSYRQIKRGIRRWLLPIAAGRLLTKSAYEKRKLLGLVRKALR